MMRIRKHSAPRISPGEGTANAEGLNWEPAWIGQETSEGQCDTARGEWY